MPLDEASILELGAPVEFIIGDRERGGPEDGIALCLSGGGYRAMLFHLGSLWRLNEFGLLPEIDRISSVSGGSIAAAQLGMQWDRLGFVNNVASHFQSQVVTPIRTLASNTIDLRSIFHGIFRRGSISDHVVRQYAKHLYGNATLQQLPDRPRFVINATNVQSGALWRFSKPYMADYRVGRVPDPSTTLAVAVAASSAFPPFLSPAKLKLAPGVVQDQEGTDLHRPPFTTDIVLSDGGVYDNLGLETAYKRYRTLLVSDGGGHLEPDATPASNWAQHGLRVVGLIDNQVRALRKRRLIASYIAGDRDGAFWGIRTDISNYGLSDALPAPHAQTMRLARETTRLAGLDVRKQERLINWGYAVCDAAMRTHLPTTAGPAPDVPYPGAGIG